MQADSLLTKTDLELFTYPLHLEIEGDVEEYREPSLSSPEQPDWLYTVVKANFQFPTDVPYQVLEDLYIPYDDENIANAQREVLPEYEEWLDEFERQAEIAAGMSETETNQRGGRWHPSGRIQVFDNSPFIVNNGVIPVHGAKVRIRDGVLFFTTLTDANGNFRFSQSRRNRVHYGIVWEREDYIIRDMSSIRARFPAFLNGPKIKGEWNTIITDRKQSYFATIHRAACDYYYHTPFGLDTPPKRHWWFGKGSILAYLRKQRNDDYTGDFYSTGPHYSGFYMRVFDADRQKINIYATVIHEYAHASHWRLRANGNIYGLNSLAFATQTRCELRESWAAAVEWMITNNTYRGIQYLNDNYARGLQDRSREDNSMIDGYTPFLIDLIDNENQRVTYGGANPENFANDDASGITIKDCENALRGVVNNFGDFYGRIVNLPISQSQIPQLNEVYSFYSTIPYRCNGKNNSSNAKIQGGE